MWGHVRDHRQVGEAARLYYNLFLNYITQSIIIITDLEITLVTSCPILYKYVIVR